VVVMADLGDLLRRLAPVVAVTYQQRHIERRQGLAQLCQVAQPEVHLARGVVVALPLAWRYEIQGDGRAAAHGAAQGGVVLGAHVAAKPHQLLHGGTSWAPSKPRRNSQACALSGSLADSRSVNESR